MTARNGIVCVEWRGPFFLRYVPRPDGVERGLTVYRVDHRGETVYVGATKWAVPTRLHRHAHDHRMPFGAFLRSTPAAEISFSVVENATRALEVALIQNFRPRFNRWTHGGALTAAHADRRVRMAAMRQAGMTYREIGEHFGVKRSAVCMALREAAA